MISNKGFELSVSVLVYFTIGIVVLIGMVMLLTGGKKGTDNVECQGNFQQACTSFVAADGCNDRTVDISSYMTAEDMICGIGSEDPDRAREACCFR